MMLDRKFSCITCSIYENPCLTKSWVVLLPPSVKSMSDQKLGYTTSSIDENQRPAKNSVVLLPPSVKVEVGPKTRLYYFLHRRKSSSDQKLGCTTSSIDKNRCSTKNSAIEDSILASHEIYVDSLEAQFPGTFSRRNSRRAILRDTRWTTPSIVVDLGSHKALLFSRAGIPKSLLSQRSEYNCERGETGYKRLPTPNDFELQRYR
ncbi:hypothetical protein HZH66_011312 [Vespula vulgaris]|uniref:Uncharacterized protein n=1 Tax=Vespula vulgaris TaxID=7454 RepID=A0A834JF44_VESVU|nr:hypothetical protein HZH66_011312 [Vespula vulgaris]